MIKKALLGIGLVLTSVSANAASYVIPTGFAVNEGLSTTAAGAYTTLNNFTYQPGAVTAGGVANAAHEFRGWVTFDLRDLASMLAPNEYVSSLSLNGDFTYSIAPEPGTARSEEVVLTSIESDLASLVNNTGVGAEQAYFNDLGDGSQYGVGVTDASCTANVFQACALSIALDSAAALADFSAAIGGWFGIGVFLNTIEGGFSQQVVSLESTGTTLNIETRFFVQVPLPATGLLLFAGLLAFGNRSARR